MRSQLKIPSQVKGAAVQSVRPASPADDAGLAPGDVIQEVNRKPVQNAEKFAMKCMQFRQAKTFCCWSGRKGAQAIASCTLSRAATTECKSRVSHRWPLRLRSGHLFCRAPRVELLQTKQVAE